MWKPLITAVLALGLTGLSLNAHAKVSAEEADKLGNELMPLGGIKKANDDGTITAWEGGIYKPEHKKGDRYQNPWPNDKPKFVITAANADQYKDKLTLGQLALLRKYDSYKIPVYETRRSTSAPDFVYKATKENALKAELANDGNSLKNAVTGIPFPIPQNGLEVVWNHKARYRGQELTRYNVQAAVQTNGAFTEYKLKEDVRFNYNIEGMKSQDLDNVLLYFLQIVLEPARQAGGILLVHDTLDQVKEVRRAWLYNKGQRRLRRAPNVGYDSPGTGADGLRFNDQLDTFNGATDRYTWKLVGKREIYTPVNSYEIHSDKYSYDDVLGESHVNQDLARYELRRVWEVDANVKEGTSHQYKRRVFYIDEDDWTIALADLYDKRDELWRVQESHRIMAYDIQAVEPALGTVYDLQSNRYLAMDMHNEEPEVVPVDLGQDYFTTNNVKKLAR